MTTTVLLDAEQEEIRSVARSFLSDRFPSDRVRELSKTEDGFEAADWNEIAELGWPAIALPEEAGGAGYTIIERCLLMEELGATLCPLPFLSSAVLAADAALLAGDGDAASELLAGLGEGTTRATLVLGGDLNGAPELGSAVAADADGNLSGSGGIVLDGATADTFLVAAGTGDGLALYAVESGAEGVAVTPSQTIDETRRTAEVSFEGAAAKLISGAGDCSEALGTALAQAAISLAAESVGGARASLEMTLAYMHEREQFGGPIGRFQVLKHRLADVHVAIDAAREVTYAAADALADGVEGADALVAAAKSSASDAYVLATAEGVQLHGGIGFTEEHDIGLFYKRALVNDALLGRPLVHRERIATSLGV